MGRYGKLTTQQVVTIREAVAHGVAYEDLAEEYAVTAPVIAAAAQGRTYRDAGGPLDQRRQWPPKGRGWNLVVRLTDAEREDLHRRAKLARLTLANFVRACLGLPASGRGRRTKGTSRKAPDSER